MTVAGSTLRERCLALGIDLDAVSSFPRVVKPRNTPVRIHGDVAYCSGVGPLLPGEPAPAGRIGDDLSAEQGYAYAQACAKRMIANLHRELGSLGRITSWLKVTGYVRCTQNFDGAAAVLNGFTDVIVEIFGETVGLAARTATGVYTLPASLPVEVEAIVAVSAEGAG